MYWKNMLQLFLLIIKLNQIILNFEDMKDDIDVLLEFQEKKVIEEVYYFEIWKYLKEYACIIGVKRGSPFNEYFFFKLGFDVQHLCVLLFFLCVLKFS